MHGGLHFLHAKWRGGLNFLHAKWRIAHARRFKIAHACLWQQQRRMTSQITWQISRNPVGFSPPPPPFEWSTPCSSIQDWGILSLNIGAYAQVNQNITWPVENLRVWRSPGGHSNGKRGYQARPWTHKKHPNHVFFKYENRPLIRVFACIFLNLSIMSFPKFVYMPKNTPFFQILHVFAPLNDVRAYSAWSWKTTLITWIFGRAWYPLDIFECPPQEGEECLFSLYMDVCEVTNI